MGIQNPVVPEQASFNEKKCETQGFLKFQLPKINLTDYPKIQSTL